MNGYPKETFNNHVRAFLSEKPMTTNSCENMNDEKKYTVIIPFIGHPCMTFKKSLAKNLESINKKCCIIFKTFKVQNYFSLKDETSWPHKQMSFIFLKVLVVRTKPILVKQKDIWQGLVSIFQEIQQFSTYIFLQLM